MNDHANNLTNPDVPELETPLDSAVWAIVGEHVPTAAIERVKQRARMLADPENVPATSETDTAQSSDMADARPAIAPGPQPSQRSKWLSVGAPVTTVASMLVLLAIVSFNPTTSLANALGKTFGQQWVHGTTTMIATPSADEGAAKPAVIESWTSTQLNILAVRMPQMIVFEDRNAEAIFNYQVGRKTVVKTLPVPRNMKSSHVNGNTLDQLMALQEEGLSTHGFVFSDVQEKNTQIDGHPFVEYSYHMSRPGSQVNDRDVRLLVNAETGLLESMEETHSNGLLSQTVFDYPDSGPTDIYDVGAPRDTKIVDRTASTDVRQVSTKWSEARVEFDSYDTVYMKVPLGLKSSVMTGLNTEIKRIRRDGNRYRVDVLLRPKPGVVAPDKTTDMDVWWKANRDNFWSAPYLICDGSKITTYLLKDGRIPKEGKPDLKVELRGENPVHGRGNDRPVAWPHLMPEFASRPHLWTTIGKRSFEFNPVPDDGPEGSVRLVVTMPDEAHPEQHRYWLDPEKGFSIVKTVHPVFRPKTDAKEIAYIDSKVASGFRQSPGGYWYPTRVERNTTTSTNTQLRTYHVDFTGELSEELFVPVNLDGQ